MKNRFIFAAKRISHNIFHNISAHRSGKHVIEKFTKKNGLIYFGSVNSRDDEHIIIRGFSASATHTDNHYCVGSIDNYDIRLVNRCDAIVKKDDSIFYNDLLIMAFDLKTNVDIPHIFINANNHHKVAYDLLFMTAPSLREVILGTFEYYSHEFTSRFTIYAAPTDSIEVEKLFPSITTRVLSTHFWPFSAEIYDGVLYIYSDANKVTMNTLDSMLSIGLWLAKNIDSVVESI